MKSFPNTPEVTYIIMTSNAFPPLFWNEQFILSGLILFTFLFLLRLHLQADLLDGNWQVYGIGMQVAVTQTLLSYFRYI